MSYINFGRVADKTFFNIYFDMNYSKMNEKILEKNVYKQNSHIPTYEIIILKNHYKLSNICACYVNIKKEL